MVQSEVGPRGGVGFGLVADRDGTRDPVRQPNGVREACKVLSSRPLRPTSKRSDPV